MTASLAVNSPLALSGAIALGLGGQVLFSLAADQWGFFGLPARRLDLRDLMAVLFILAGSVLVIISGGAQA
nr:DMT family transporter [Marinicella sp. W31]MDC2879365.1 DMT family transporter [Marinicella sp. W31]